MARSSDRYSIAQAKDKLPSLVHQVERGRPIELTRRGKPVAVIVSAGEYARLAASRPTFGAALKEFLDRWPAAGDGIDDDFFRGLRDENPGRGFAW